MYTEPKFLAMKEKSKAKRMAELLRVIILQLGDDVARARREFETYAECTITETLSRKSDIPAMAKSHPNAKEQPSHHRSDSRL